MKRNATAALGAALTAMTPVGVALAAQTGTATQNVKPDPLPLRTQVHGKGSIEARMRVSGHRIAAHRRLVARNEKLARKVHGLSEHAARHHAAVARRWSNPRLRRQNHRLERELRAASTTTTAPAPGSSSASATTSGVSSSALAAIRSCESGGNYSTSTGNGFYGAYQFTQSTWASVGGTGSPASASPAEQDRRAAILYSRSGAGQWPVCGH